MYFCYADMCLFEYFNTEYIQLLMQIFVAVGVLGLFVNEIFAKRDKPMENIAAGILAWIYIGVPFALLNYMLNPMQDIEFYASDILLGFFGMVWINDTFAYLFGVSLGKHRLCERLSPKKSWEGAIGGLLGSLLFAYLWSYYGISLPLWMWMLMALLTVIFSIIGDLTESMFKRNVDMKDSGNLLPGHGGILDRFDSVLLAAPAAFALLWIYFNFYLWL